MAHVSSAIHDCSKNLHIMTKFLNVEDEKIQSRVYLVELEKKTLQ